MFSSLQAQVIIISISSGLHTLKTESLEIISSFNTFLMMWLTVK